MTLNRFLSRLVIGCLFAALLTPLVVISSWYFPYITGKAIFFRLVVEVALAAWVLLALRDPDYRPKRSIVLWAILSWLGVATLATIFSVDPINSFWSNFERMEGLVTYLHLGAFFLVLISVFKTTKIWERYFSTSVWISAIISGYGLLQLSGFFVINQGGIRVDATLGNATYLAVYLLINIFLAVLMWSRSGVTAVGKWVFGLIAILDLILLYFTATRGAILGLVLGALVTAFLLGLTRPGRVRRGAIILAIFLVILAGSFWMVRDQDWVKNNSVLSRFASISLSDNTVASRFLIWKMGWQAAQDKPILGWGPNNFNQVFSRYYNPSMCRQEPWFDRAHNVFMDWLVSAGFLGFLAYLSIYLSAAWLLWRLARARRGDDVHDFLLIGLLVAYLFNNIFVFDNLVSYVLFMIILGYVHFLWTNDKPVKAGIAKQLSPILANSLGGLVIVAIVIGSYWLAIKPAIAARTLVKAIAPIQAQNNEEAAQIRLGLFKKALSLGPVGVNEAREQLGQMASSALTNQEVSRETKQAVLDLFTAETEAYVAESLYDSRPPYFLGHFYASLGDSTRAIKALEEALKRSPQKDLIYFDLASVYLNLGQLDKTRAIVDQIYQLDPSCPGSAVAKANMFILNRQLAEAKQILFKTFATTTVSDDRLINFYENGGYYNEIIPILEFRIKTNEKDPNARLALAVVLAKMGNFPRAIAELEQIKKIDPSLAGQVDKFLTEVKAGRIPQ